MISQYSTLCIDYKCVPTLGHPKVGQSVPSSCYDVFKALFSPTSDKGQPLYKGQNGWSQTCPFFGGSTVCTWCFGCGQEM